MHFQKQLREEELLFRRKDVDFFYRANFKKFLTLAKMQPEKIIEPDAKERRKFELELKIADAAITIG